MGSVCCCRGHTQPQTRKEAFSNVLSLTGSKRVHCNGALVTDWSMQAPAHSKPLFQIGLCFSNIPPSIFITRHNMNFSHSVVLLMTSSIVLTSATSPLYVTNLPKLYVYNLAFQSEFIIPQLDNYLFLQVTKEQSRGSYRKHRSGCRFLLHS